jgi:hypothetical protein
MFIMSDLLLLGVGHKGSGKGMWVKNPDNF